MLYNDKEKLIREYIKWIRKNHFKQKPLTLIMFLSYHGYLNEKKILKDLKFINKKKENEL